MKDLTTIKGHKYMLYAEDARGNPQFVGLADTVEEARSIRFDAELAGFKGVAIIDGRLTKVE
jgi:Xaa-Pro aminopeptidase